jgi:hypothetical protein
MIEANDSLLSIFYNVIIIIKITHLSTFKTILIMDDSERLHINQDSKGVGSIVSAVLLI